MGGKQFLSPGSIQLYYHHSEIAFLCLFRENVCCFQSHVLEISDAGWKVIPGIRVSNGAIFKGQNLHYSFKSIPNSCYGDGCCYGLQKSTWQQWPLTSHPPLRWRNSGELTFSLFPHPNYSHRLCLLPFRITSRCCWVLPLPEQCHFAPWHEKEHNDHKHF